MRLILASLLLSASLPAEVAVPNLDYYLPKGANSDPAIPTPQQTLGFQIGEWHLHHHELVHYLQHLDAKSDRVAIKEYARSHHRRPLLCLTITAPENHARLEEIRQAHIARIQSPEQNPDLARTPIVIWMGYGVHGNEPSASHAAVLLAYHLASARDQATLDLLKHAVILLEPCLNPDGFERFSDWTNSHRGHFPSANRADREHQEGWPTGRSNYYWFDLNRDWLPAVHPESQGRLKLYHQWQPTIVTDYHEMGNVNRTYFFQPGIAKMAHPLIPKQNQVLTEKMAREHAKALDAIGSLYYTGESFDDFYIGKGSTYADVTSSVGVLFEQASSRGFHQDTEHGRLTFPFTIRNQFTTSLSTLRSAHALRPEFLAYQQTFYREALADAAASKIKAHVFAAPGDPERLQAFQKLLALHHIQAFQPAEDLIHEDQTFPASASLVVPVEQLQFRLLTAMFETRTQFASNIFYDVSAWHLPSAYGLQYAEWATLPPVVLTKPEPPVKHTVTGPAKPYAYVFSWDPRFAPRALFHLLQAKARVWMTTRAFTVNTDASPSTYPNGSIIVPVATQDVLPAAELHRLMHTLATDNHLPVHAIASGYHGSVPNLGSPTFQPVEPPEVLLLVGPGVGSTSAGEIWHQFDEVWHTPLTMAEAPQITASLLQKHSHVILTDTALTVLSVTARSALQTWVSRGGTLIAIGSSAKSLAEQEWCKVELVKAPAADDSKSKSGKPAQQTLPYDQADERRTAKELNGIIVRAVFDPTHPLAFGLGGRKHLHLMRDGTTFLKPASSTHLNPVQYTDTPLVSGYASKANQDAMKHSTPVQIKPVDSGRVIFFTDNPVFRGHWLGTEKLLANALFFGHLVKAAGGDEADDEHAEASQD
jgi:hypothetical protein